MLDVLKLISRRSILRKVLLPHLVIRKFLEYRGSKTWIEKIVQHQRMMMKQWRSKEITPYFFTLLGWVQNLQTNTTSSLSIQLQTKLEKKREDKKRQRETARDSERQRETARDSERQRETPMNKEVVGDRRTPLIVCTQGISWLLDEAKVPSWARNA